MIATGSIARKPAARSDGNGGGKIWDSELCHRRNLPSHRRGPHLLVLSLVTCVMWCASSPLLAVAATLLTAHSQSTVASPQSCHRPCS
ncbi:hypothetical protein PIB30_051605 [Stylosanthes scabra]|uniref:Uncharacterized protein n=1 Tax=Stylosanthes scabra TaxID=79078 RepID=A0ABU6QHV6_9FABA|nr:hypothetical protein [Stylosanthes scabra]